MENPNDEPVLLVPPKLTKSAYAILLDHNLVPRKWHPEGRYGSRTHKFKDKIGLPLLSSCQVQIQTIQAMLDPNHHHHHHHHHRPNDSIGIHASISLCKLLKEPGVELVFKPAVVSNRIPRDEPFDASIHPHLMPEQFSTKLKKMIQNMQECSNPSSSSSPLSSPLSSPSPWKKQRNTPLFTFCELFAGIGGFGVALEALGGKCVFASEIYAPSKSVYENNADTSMLPLPHHRVSGDIWDISSANIPRHDLLVAGFPCQPFSSLGDQPGLNDGKHISGRNHCLEGESEIDAEHIINSGGGRGQLFTQIVRILKDVQPHAFLLENVPGLVTTDGGNALRTIVEALEGVGYRVKHEICSARGMTVQSRKRLYIVGILELKEEVDVNDDGSVGSREFQFPFMPDLQLRAKHILHSERELDASFTATGIPEELMEDCDFGDDVPTPAQLYRLTDAQMDQLRNRSKVWRPAKLAWGNTSCDTIDSHYGITIGKGNSQLVPCSAPFHPRRFTPRECARTMGFSNSFKLGMYRNKKTAKESKHGDEAISTFNGYIKENYYMLGNAVCPPVIAVLAGAILNCIPSIGGYQDWAERGLWTGIELSFNALSPIGKKEIQDGIVALDPH